MFNKLLIQIFYTTAPLPKLEKIEIITSQHY
jgi:hypothetical protein